MRQLVTAAESQEFAWLTCYLLGAKSGRQTPPPRLDCDGRKEQKRLITIIIVYTCAV